MIEVTERAKQELKKILFEKVDDPLAGLRLTTDSQGQLGLSIDVEASGDKVVEYEGSKVLMVDEGLIDSLGGLTLDVEDTSEGSKLVLTRES
jgi:Fe-S cluster assembly iron-binding protein IscA